jgi:Zn finger protein HypA/HybF involved in hydrogenase expression
MRVECDKCGCKYAFQITRLGSGAAEAPFMIGQESAAARAEEGARKDLMDRLAVEAELVPCPECHWISDDLVEEDEHLCRLIADAATLR